MAFLTRKSTSSGDPIKTAKRLKTDPGLAACRATIARLETKLADIAAGLRERSVLGIDSRELQQRRDELQGQIDAARAEMADTERVIAGEVCDTIAPDVEAVALRTVAAAEAFAEAIEAEQAFFSGLTAAGLSPNLRPAAWNPSPDAAAYLAGGPCPSLKLFVEARRRALKGVGSHGNRHDVTLIGPNDLGC